MWSEKKKNPLTSCICAEQEAQPPAWNNGNVLGTLGYETAVFILLAQSYGVVQ